MLNMNRKKHRSFSFDDFVFCDPTGHRTPQSATVQAHRRAAQYAPAPRSGRYELIDFTNRVRAQISELKAFEEFDNALAHERSRRDHVSARVLRNSRVGKEIHKCA